MRVFQRMFRKLNLELLRVRGRSYWGVLEGKRRFLWILDLYLGRRV